jgi:hypothetical protein
MEATKFVHGMCEVDGFLLRKKSIRKVELFRLLSKGI